jgi:hypothetical protein
LSLSSGLLLELLTNVILYQLALHHLDQVPARFVWTDKPNRATTPSVVLEELMVESTMLFVVRIECYQWTGVVL